MPATASQVQGVELLAPVPADAEDILTAEALQFVADLERLTRNTRRQLLQSRVERQVRLDAGELPDFLPETAEIRASDWTVAPVPADLQDRRVEITGPVDRKMVINALNSGAKMYMADFEDSHAPTWQATIAGQVNLRDAVNGTIEYTSAKGKHYTLDKETATLLVRPRGWHLDEKHVLVDGEPMSAGIFDFGLYFFHNAQALLDKGTGPYFYLPKLESHLEARLWNEVFRLAQDGPGPAARHDQSHGADRNDPGCVRDGRNPLRAAQPRRGPELRPLGLHLQLHQEVPKSCPSACCRIGPR